MSHSRHVFRIQLAMFSREKGMLVFYLLCIAIIGVAVPVFTDGMESALPMAALMTVMFLKPVLSDSLAGERERETLESLLSTPISGKGVVWGKSLFCLLFAAGFFAMSAGCAAATCLVAGYRLNMAAWQWACVMFLSLLNFSAVSIAGTCASAVSADSRIAGGKVSRIAYPLGLLLVVYLSVVFMAEPVAALVSGGAIALVYLCVIAFYGVKASRMGQAGYFENVKIKKIRKVRDNYAPGVTPKLQFSVVSRHELRYFLTLKMLLT